MREFSRLLLLGALATAGVARADGLVVQYTLTATLVETDGVDILGLDGAVARFEFVITDVGFVHGFDGSRYITQYDAVPSTGSLRLTGTAGNANDGTAAQDINGRALLRSWVTAPPGDSLSFAGEYDVGGHRVALREHQGGLFFSGNEFLFGGPLGPLLLPSFDLGDVVSNDFELKVLGGTKEDLCGFGDDCYALDLIAVSAPEGSAAACSGAALAALAMLLWRRLHGRYW